MPHFSVDAKCGRPFGHATRTSTSRERDTGLRPSYRRSGKIQALFQARQAVGAYDRPHKGRPDSDRPTYGPGRGLATRRDRRVIGHAHWRTHWLPRRW